MLMDSTLYAHDFCLLRFFWIALICCKNFKNLNIFRPWLIEPLIFSATRKLNISLALHFYVIFAKVKEITKKLRGFLQIWGFHWVDVRVFHAMDVEIREILDHGAYFVAAFRRTHQTCDGGHLFPLKIHIFKGNFSEKSWFLPKRLWFYRISRRYSLNSELLWDYDWETLWNRSLMAGNSFDFTADFQQIYFFCFGKWIFALLSENLASIAFYLYK